MSANRTMTAAVFERKGVLTVKDVPVPAIQHDDDVLIRVKAISICGTDVRALTDPPAFLFNEGIVVGHEFTGVIESAGAGVSNVAVGDTVVVHPNIWCGKCHYCRTGHINLCENFTHIGDRIDGAMAEYACVPERMVYRISPSVPAHIACLAEPLACVLNGTTAVRAHPGETVVVLGAGPIGLIFMMLYQAAGARVILSDVMANRRAFALQLGADGVVDPGSEDVAKVVRDMTTIGADIVVDAVGMLLNQAIQVVRKGGRIVLFGINETAQVQVHQSSIVSKELTIQGAYITKGTMPAAVRIIERGIIPIEKLVTHRLPIQDVKRGLELMKTGEGSKVIIEME